MDDTGGAIFGVYFDVFVGNRALRKHVRLPDLGHVWYAGIEQRIRQDIVRSQRISPGIRRRCTLSPS